MIIGQYKENLVSARESRGSPRVSYLSKKRENKRKEAGNTFRTHGTFRPFATFMTATDAAM